MSLQSISFTRLSEADIQRLIDGRVAESVTLDYKQQTYGRSDSDKREFRKDISALANSLGGDIVIGVAEEDGFPSALIPIEANIDEELQRLEDMAASNVEPRIPNLQIRFISLNGGGNLIVVRVPRSFLAPHRITRDQHSSFHGRSGTTTYELNVEQLRRMFNAAPIIADKIKMFHAERLMKISAADTPIPMMRGGKLVIHVVPLPAFVDGSMTDLVARLSEGKYVPIPPDELQRLNRERVNLDGYLNHTAPNSTGSPRTAYAQFFRNGVIEGVADLRQDKGEVTHFIGLPFVQLVVKSVRQYLDTIRHYDLGLPCYVFISLCNVAQTIYRYDAQGGGFLERDAGGREIIALPEMYFDNFDADVAKALRPAFNVLWNAFGQFHCDVYDTDGEVPSANKF